MWYVVFCILCIIRLHTWHMYNFCGSKNGRKRLPNSSVRICICCVKEGLSRNTDFSPPFVGVSLSKAIVDHMSNLSFSSIISSTLFYGLSFSIHEVTQQYSKLWWMFVHSLIKQHTIWLSGSDGLEFITFSWHAEINCIGNRVLMWPLFLLFADSFETLHNFVDFIFHVFVRVKSWNIKFCCLWPYSPVET